MTPIGHSLFDKMIERVKRYKAESDTEYFLNLMYLGELIVKYSTLSVVSGLINDANKNKYSHQCQLVRADGIGEWGKVLDEILVGPSNHLVMLEMQEIVRDLNNLNQKGSWQFESVNILRECLILLNEDVEQAPVKIPLRNWINQFARIRNKTRGHGAQKSEVLGNICPLLEKSLQLILDNFALFKLETIYLHRNISGRYKISYLSSISDRFDYLRTSEGQNYNLDDGVYLYVNSLIKVDLLETDFDLTDFYFPNGGFSKKTYESLSYISGNKNKKDNSSFLIPPNDLPGSDTDGLKALEVIGNCFTNIPKSQTLYIPRESLEDELAILILNDRHSIITLYGRGGIGKTTLALKVLHDICEEQRFSTILWFSARDIDLLEEGIKPVKPQVLGIDDISKYFVRLLDVNRFKVKGFNPRKFIETQLNKSEVGPILIVIDNFETIENPTEVYAWLDTHIRLPNKILITSRIKDSKGDYPMTVSGMTRSEFTILVTKVSEQLNITHLINKEFIDKLFQESAGHPYIAKVMLGEISKEKQTGSIKRIAASKDELLTALFERTFNMLSPGSKLVFLTLSSWRSIIPSVAIESVLKTKSEEFYEIDDAIEELYRFSFVDKIKLGKNSEEEFLFLPLSAHLFGQKKLSVSPLKRQISEYLWYLNFFGVGHIHNIGQGLKYKISLFFRQVSSYLISNKDSKVDNFIPILEYICHKHPYAWNTLSFLYEENNMLEQAIDANRKFIQYEENDSNRIDAWIRISRLSKKCGKFIDEAQALVEICSIDKCPYEYLSNSARRIHHLIRERRIDNTIERKALLNEFIEVFESRTNLNEGSFDDKVELGWLYLNSQKVKEAKKIAKEVLAIDSENSNARKLLSKIG